MKPRSTSAAPWPWLAAWAVALAAALWFTPRLGIALAGVTAALVTYATATFSAGARLARGEKPDA